MSISKIWNIIKEVDEIMIYFPNYKPKEKLERSYLIAMISTINPEATKEIVANAKESYDQLQWLISKKT